MGYTFIVLRNSQTSIGSCPGPYSRLWISPLRVLLVIEVEYGPWLKGRCTLRNGIKAKARAYDNVPERRLSGMYTGNTQELKSIPSYSRHATIVDGSRLSKVCLPAFPIISRAVGFGVSLTVKRCFASFGTPDYALYPEL